MRTITSIICAPRLGPVIALLACAAFFVTWPLRAGDSSDGKSTADGKTPPVTTAEPEPEYKNWIELGIGGLIINGDSAQFKQQHDMSGDVYGGISDMHYEQTVGKNAQFTADGHAIFDNNDYDIKLQLSLPKVGYISGGFTEFRTWYDGNGGFFPPHNTFFAPPFPEMHIDRGDAWVEVGLRVPDWPEITIRYSHEFRDGQKDSTIWGDTALTGLPLPSPTPPASNAQRNPTRKIAPAYRDIDETRDIFSLEATKSFGNTDVGLGMRYERDINDDRLQLWRNAGQFATILAPPPAFRIVGPNGSAAAERFITQHEKDDLDLFSGHGTVETHFSDTLWFTAAYSYTSLNGDLSGTRIIGPGYNSTYSDPILTLQSNDHGFLNLAGDSQVEDNVVNLNLLWMPLKDLTFLTAFRYTYEQKNSDDMFFDTNTAANTAPFTPTNPRGGFHRVPNPVLRSADTAESFNNFAERMELRYAGINNWLFYAEGEWEEENGTVFEHEIVGGVNQGNLNKDTSLLAQKYTAGANWYPMDRLALSGQYYHKIVSYDNSYDSELAVAPVPGSERNQRLIGQDWTTDDFNVRLTWRPKIPAKLGTLALVSRYDYVSTLISGKWAVSPTQSGTITTPPTPATNTIYDSEHTAFIFSHMITETLTWNPLARLYFQGEYSYVISQTSTPVDGVVLNGVTANAQYTSPTFQDYNNDYWTITAATGYVLDDKTDLRADYTYYRAGNYLRNAQVAMPYGTTDSESTVSATATRQLTKRMRVLVKYTYFTYENNTSGNRNNYEAHSIYSGLQIRF
jgi:hypothetical protein